MSEGPLPPVDDPLLDAALAKVAGAAGEPSVIIEDDPDLPLVPEPAVPVAVPGQAATKPVAVAAKPRRPATAVDDDDDGDDDERGRRPGRSPLVLLVTSLVVLGTLGIGALILLGRLNKENYNLACEPERVLAEQGRGFPPWGSSPLDGKQWNPIKIPPNTECIAHETKNLQELSDWYRQILSERASVLLSAHEVTGADDAAALLDQALLHTRSDARRSEREDLKRLLGDVEYWRATAKVRAAQAALVDAAKQFDDARAALPRYVADAGDWALFARKLAAQLEGGPGAAPAVSSPTATGSLPSRATAPLGTALPVDGVESAPAEPAMGSATPPPPPTSGGVLL